MEKNVDYKKIYKYSFSFSCMKIKIKEFLKKIRKLKEFKRIEFIILYGSHANKKANKMSDVDICIYYDADEKEVSKFRLKLLSLFDYDIQMYQQIPIYIKKEVLKGKVLYVKNLMFLYEVALQTIKEFEEFKARYYDYINVKKMV